jgi:hypothetical protein
MIEVTLTFKVRKDMIHEALLELERAAYALDRKLIRKGKSTISKPRIEMSGDVDVFKRTKKGWSKD